MTVEQELHEHKSEHNLSFNIYIGICSEQDSRAKTVDTMEKVAALSHDVKHFSWREWMRSNLISKINATLQSNRSLQIVMTSDQRIGKGQFLFQSQRKAMPKNAQNTTQLHSSHTLVK